jgi:hypothetical protein
MRNPWWHFKQLPWQSLIQSALATVLSVMLLEVLLPLIVRGVPGVAPLFDLLFAGALGSVTLLAIAVGVGALAVVYFEYFERARITARSLWGLVLCLAIAFALRQLFPLAPWLLQLDYAPLMGLIVGVFWKGRKYWRSYQRW